MPYPFEEIPPFSVKPLRFQSGERFSGMVDSRGMLTSDPNVYAMVHLREGGRSASTIDAHMRAIRLALNWAAERGVDLRARTLSLQMLSYAEVVDLKDALRVNRRETDRQIGGGGASRQATVAVAAATLYNRVIMVRDYLAWFGRRALHAIRTDDPKLTEARTRLERFEQMMAANLPYANSQEREGWSDEAQSLFKEVIRPEDPRNPFKKEHRHRNHALLLLYWETGSRRGEVLKLTGEQCKLHGDKPAVHFRRNPDDPRDPRLVEPNVKTQEHEDSISPETASVLRAWIQVHRRDVARYPGAKKSPYVFVARTGKPLAARTVNHMFALLKRKFPELGRHVFPHILRNTFNDRFSAAAEEQGLNEAEERQARNYTNGWAKNSNQGDRYRVRHTRRTSEKVMRTLHEKSVEGRNR